jgi:hypothetical protein
MEFEGSAQLETRLPQMARCAFYRQLWLVLDGNGRNTQVKRQTV